MDDLRRAAVAAEALLAGACRNPSVEITGRSPLIVGVLDEEAGLRVLGQLRTALARPEAATPLHAADALAARMFSGATADQLAAIADVVRYDRRHVASLMRRAHLDEQAVIALIHALEGES